MYVVLYCIVLVPVDVDVSAADPAILLDQREPNGAASTVVAADVFARQLGKADKCAAQEEDPRGEAVKQLAREQNFAFSKYKK